MVELPEKMLPMYKDGLCDVYDANSAKINQIIDYLSANKPSEECNCIGMDDLVFRHKDNCPANPSEREKKMDTVKYTTFAMVEKAFRLCWEDYRNYANENDCVIQDEDAYLQNAKDILEGKTKVEPPSVNGKGSVEEKMNCLEVSMMAGIVRKRIDQKIKKELLTSLLDKLPKEKEFLWIAYDEDSGEEEIMEEPPDIPDRRSGNAIHRGFNLALKLVREKIGEVLG